MCCAVTTVVAAYCLLSICQISICAQLSDFGKCVAAAPWLWQLLGVCLVFSLRVSAWHLVWWFMGGYLLTMSVTDVIIGKGLYFDSVWNIESRSRHH
jgi:hypothetical protein